MGCDPGCAIQTSFLLQDAFGHVFITAIESKCGHPLTFGNSSAALGILNEGSQCCVNSSFGIESQLLPSCSSASVGAHHTQNTPGIPQYPQGSPELFTAHDRSTVPLACRDCSLVYSRIAFPIKTAISHRKDLLPLNLLLVAYTVM